MTTFYFARETLHIERVPIEAIVKDVGTPVYIYSAGRILENYQRFDRAFQALPHEICYAVKANSNLSILRLLAQAGAGADIVSGGELYRAVKAGIPPEKITYSGVGKTAREILEALDAGVRRLHVESLQEFDLICEIIRQRRIKIQVAPRINPDIDAQTHPYISTGLRQNKFGLNVEDARAIFEQSKAFPQIRVNGISAHIGSQITTLSPFIEATTFLANFIREQRRKGFQIDSLDIGGGLGLTYNQERPPTPEEYGNALAPLLQSLECRLLLEPGRAIVGDAGALVTKVLYTKETKHKHFTIVDASMTDCLRPALYQAYHEVLPIKQPSSERQPCVLTDIVGPVCESSDFLAKERQLPALRRGDLIAFLTAGAYGFAMSSQYNSRPRSAEALVDKENFHIIRRRETYEDVIRGEE